MIVNLDSPGLAEPAAKRTQPNGVVNLAVALDLVVAPVARSSSKPHPSDSSASTSGKMIQQMNWVIGSASASGRASAGR
jgi:hypothetical protein